MVQDGQGQSPFLSLVSPAAASSVTPLAPQAQVDSRVIPNRSSALPARYLAPGDGSFGGPRLAPVTEVAPAPFSDSRVIPNREGVAPSQLHDSRVIPSRDDSRVIPSRGGLDLPVRQLNYNAVSGG